MRCLEKEIPRMSKKTSSRRSTCRPLDPRHPAQGPLCSTAPAPSWVRGVPGALEEPFFWHGTNPLEKWRLQGLRSAPHPARRRCGRVQGPLRGKGGFQGAAGVFLAKTKGAKKMAPRAKPWSPRVHYAKEPPCRVMVMPY